jgi:hypothetical protein
MQQPRRQNRPPASTDGSDQETGKWRKQKGDIGKTTISNNAPKRKRRRQGAMAAEAKANANHTTKTTIAQMRVQKPIALNAAATPLNTDPPASTDGQQTEAIKKQGNGGSRKEAMSTTQTQTSW